MLAWCCPGDGCVFARRLPRHLACSVCRTALDHAVAGWSGFRRVDFPMDRAGRRKCPSNSYKTRQGEAFHTLVANVDGRSIASFSGSRRPVAPSQNCTVKLRDSPNGRARPALEAALTKAHLHRVTGKQVSILPPDLCCKPSRL